MVQGRVGIATLSRGNDKKPLVARFGGIPLVPNKKAIVVDQVSPPIRYDRKEVVRRLLANVNDALSKTKVVWFIRSANAARSYQHGETTTTMGTDHAQEKTQNPYRLSILSSCYP
jgi:hypothetical protein